MFLMFDSRAASGDTSSAVVLDTAATLDDVAMSNRAHRGQAYAWYECSIGPDGKTVTPGAYRPDLERHGIGPKQTPQRWTVSLIASPAC